MTAPIGAIALGGVLGLGLVLVASVFLWPRRPGEARGRGRPAELLRSRLVLAGLPDVPVTVFVMLSLVAAVLFAGLAQGLVGLIAITVAAAVSGLAGPTLVIAWRASIRRRRNRAVWPDVVDHLVAAVRSGRSLPDALGSLGLSGPAATRDAFVVFSTDFSSTGDFGHALDELKSRLGDPTADRLLETLRMAREVGGSELTIVLSGLGRYLRGEAAVRLELETRQGWVMNAARLGAVAPWLVLLLLATRREAVEAYNTPAGILVLAAGGIVTLVAYRTMRAIGRLPEERRWFA